MSYGFEIRNALGDLILDDHAAFYIQESGVTAGARDIGLVGESGGDSNPIFPPNQVAWSRFVLNATDDEMQNYPHFIGSSTAAIIGGFNACPTPLWPRSAMAFYQPGSIGLTMSTAHYIGPEYTLDATPATGLYFMNHADQNAALNYLVADTEIGPVSGNYGMQVRDGTGAVTFDSRADLFSILDTVKIDQATVADILFNDAQVDVTMPEPLPGCYISCPYFAAFRLTSSIYERVRIRQITASTLRLDRAEQVFGQSGQSGNYTHDIFIFIARDPFA